MKRGVLAVILLFGCVFGVGAEELSREKEPRDSLRVLFWNLENFFDFRNDSTSVSDAEFSSRGMRHWTRKRFYTKCNAVAKTLLWTGAPDIAAFAEVENAFVLRRLVAATPLYKTDYRTVHYDSPDPRGIDVALLYRDDRLELLESKPLHVYWPGCPDSLLFTRDILLARFRPRPSGLEFFLLVCHLPSKYGGAAASAPRRAAAVVRLHDAVDSLSRAAGLPIILCGDFNDTPENPDFQMLKPELTNLSEPLAAKGEGTLRYGGKWDLIDQFWVTADGVRDVPDTLSSADSSSKERPAELAPVPRLQASMRILRPPFLLTRDSAHGGLKPLRTYSGPRYLGGVSDHLPVLLQISFPYSPP
jgi:endonuclease/exonuclease/phosphatase family metal-dependent hydrolase